MNERIEQLAKQAVLQANEVFDQKGKDYQRIVLEKFAELIVGECANVLQKEIKTAIAHDGKETHIDLILIEHFGVEE